MPAVMLSIIHMPISTSSTGTKVSVLGGHQIRKGDLNEADSSYKNTTTKAGKKRPETQTPASFLNAERLNERQNFKGTICQPTGLPVKKKLEPDPKPMFNNQGFRAEFLHLH